MDVKNIYQFSNLDMSQEQFTELFAAQNFRAERIVSFGQTSPEGYWYDQDENEWVMLLQGAAQLIIEGSEQPLNLLPGDYLLLLAHVRHRVIWTDPQCETVWLTIHFPS